MLWVYPIMEVDRSNETFLETGLCRSTSRRMNEWSGDMDKVRQWCFNVSLTVQCLYEWGHKGAMPGEKKIRKRQE